MYVLQINDNIKLLNLLKRMVWSIVAGNQNVNLMTIFLNYYKYALITSVDVKSKYFFTI